MVNVPAERSGLEKNLVAIASPYTIPKNGLVRDSRQGSLAPPLYLLLEDALKGSSAGHGGRIEVSLRGFRRLPSPSMKRWNSSLDAGDRRRFS